jgi:hypothetical protein
LAPVCGTAEISTSTTEVATTAAKSVAALAVHYCATCLTLSGDTLLSSRVRRTGLVVALSEASLAAVAAVQVLVLERVLGSAVTGRRAAAVEVSVGAGSGACDTALGVTADVDLRDRSGEGLRGRRTLGGADLHCRWGSRLAGR